MGNDNINESNAPDPRDLERRLRTRREGLDQLQLLTKTLVSLELNDRTSILDTLCSMVGSFLGVRHALSIIEDVDDGSLKIAGASGIDDQGALLGEDAQALWRWLMQERVSGVVTAEDARRRWPELPEFLREGAACVSLDVRDRPVGVMVFARKESGEEIETEAVELLDAVAGIASMALANADGHTAQRRLIEHVEIKALEAQSESREKEQALAELDKKLDIIRQQQSAIRELSTPILRLWDDVLAMPVIGVVDSRRSLEIMERLLTEVTAQQARFVIVDITGVDVVDTRTADHFIKVIQAAELLGTTCILTGIRPAVAQTLVEIGVNLSSVITLRNLQDGLKECLRLMNDKRRTADAA